MLPAAIRAAIVEQARAELPNECCGFLAGRREDGGAVGRVIVQYPLINEAASPTEFWSEAKSVFAAHKDMDSRGLDLLAIYHSHPTSRPVPSKKDREQSYYGEDVMNLIISLAADQPELTAWWITHEQHRPAEWREV